MIRRLTAVALISSCAVATTAWGQANGQPVSASAPGATVPAPGQAASPMLRQDARPHDDADARECLEFLTNTGVIRCAERYRNNAKRPQR